MTFWRNSDCTGDHVPITLDQASQCINIDSAGSTYNSVSDLVNYLGDEACTFFIPPNQPGSDRCSSQEGIDLEDGNNTACYGLHRPTFRVGSIAECLKG